VAIAEQSINCRNSVRHSLNCLVAMAEHISVSDT